MSWCRVNLETFQFTADYTDVPVCVNLLEALKNINVPVDTACET